MAVETKKEKPKVSISIFNVVSVLIIIALAVALGYVVYSNMGNSALAESNLKKIYKFQTGTDLEIISTNEQNGLYRYIVRSGNNMQDIYMTKDGIMLVNGLIDVDKYLANMENQRNFTQCLINKSIVIVGMPTDNYTIMQLQILGAYSSALLFDCSTNMQECINANITTIPTTIYKGARYEGIRDVGFFEQLTGCSLKR